MAEAPPLDLSRAELTRDLDGILAVDAATFDRPWTRAMYEWEWTHSDVARFYVARTAGATGEAGAVVAYARDTLEKHEGWEGQGLLLNAPRPHVLRFMPALNVTEGEIDRMLAGLRLRLDAVR